jgi:hypothetical protein
MKPIEERIYHRDPERNIYCAGESRPHGEPCLNLLRKKVYIHTNVNPKGDSHKRCTMICEEHWVGYAAYGGFTQRDDGTWECLYDVGNPSQYMKEAMLGGAISWPEVK